MKTAIVLGGGGFIGSHLVNRLKSEGYHVRAVDLKKPEFSKSGADEFFIGDLRKPEIVATALNNTPAGNFDEVYQLAADMGGCQYVFSGDFDADIMHNSATINLNVADCLAKSNFKGKVFYSSSACMYPQELQNDDNNFFSKGDGNVRWASGLKESDAYPGNPDSEYGWEKLFSERLFLAYQRNYGLNVRIARFHNIYGPEGTYQGGREKAPASICRKVIESLGNYQAGSGGYTGSSEIEIWGDGKQTRSFLYIDDCIDAVRLLMQTEPIIETTKTLYKEGNKAEWRDGTKEIPAFCGPVNIGSEEMVSINELWDLAISFSGKSIEKKHTDMPKGFQGVRGRNSDNTLIRKVLNWEPKYSLKEGLEKTYQWIKSQYEINSNN